MASLDETALVQKIVEWCSREGESESRFLTPDPQHYVFTFSLFDQLSRWTGIEESVIGEWFNDEQERIGK